MPNERRRISSGGPFEARFGYSRAVVAGSHVYVAGTTSLNPDGSVHGAGDAYEQAKRCLEIITSALSEAQAEVADVVRTRMFVTDAAYSNDVGRAHGEVFANVRPAATMVVVAALIDPALLVEIEAEAVIRNA